MQEHSLYNRPIISSTIISLFSFFPHLVLLTNSFPYPPPAPPIHCKHMFCHSDTSQDLFLVCFNSFIWKDKGWVITTGFRALLFVFHLSGLYQSIKTAVSETSEARQKSQMSWSGISMGFLTVVSFFSLKIFNHCLTLRIWHWIQKVFQKLVVFHFIPPHSWVKAVTVSRPYHVLCVQSAWKVFITKLSIFHIHLASFLLWLDRHGEKFPHF